MASPSGTTSFNPDLGQLSAFALGRVGVRRPEITVDNLSDVSMAANLVLVDWSVDQPQLWGVELQSVALVQGTQTYVLPANLLLLLDAYITVSVGGISQDRVIYGVSRTEYDAYPIKLMEAFPTVYWFNRVIPPQITLYPTPDQNGPYTLNYHGVFQDDDAVLAGAAGLDLPYRAFSAFTDALAAKLAPSYMPANFPMLNTIAQSSYERLRAQENESVPLYIQPGVSGYWR